MLGRGIQEYNPVKKPFFQLARLICLMIVQVPNEDFSERGSQLTNMKLYFRGNVEKVRNGF